MNSSANMPWRMPRWAMPLIGGLMAVGAFAQFINSQPSKVDQLFSGLAFGCLAVSAWLSPPAFHQHWRQSSVEATPLADALNVLGGLFFVCSFLIHWFV